MAIIKKSEAEQAMPDWCSFSNGVYPVRILFFVGSRTSMCRDILDGLSMLDDKLSGEDAGAFALKVRQMFGTERRSINGESLRIEIDNGLNLWIVRVDRFRGYVEDTALLSHECLHAALSVLGYCGVSEDPPFEALCYLHEAIFKKFMMFAFGRVGMLHYGNPENRMKETGNGEH